MKMPIALPLLFLATACALSGHNAIYKSPIFEFHYDDNIENGRIDLSLKSKAETQLCIGFETWPDVFGRTEAAYGTIFLEVDAKKYILKTEPILDHCMPIACSTIVASYATIRGHFNYSDFGLPLDKYKSKKILNWNPMPSRCNPLMY